MSSLSLKTDCILVNTRTVEKMTETYPQQPDVLLSDDTYALRISIFEDGTEMGFHDYREEEQYAIRACILDLIPIVNSRIAFDIDSVIDADNGWSSVLVCYMDREYRIPFPLSLMDRVVYYSSGEERRLVGQKLLIHPRSDKYKWANKVELLLEEYDDE